MALVALAIVGFAVGPINPLLFTVQTEIVSAALRGRIFGAVRRGCVGSDPPRDPARRCRGRGDRTRPTFLAMGLLLAAVVAYGFFNPAFREMDHRSFDETAGAAEQP